MKSPLKSPFRLFSNSITIGIWTFISRISGLAREIIFAALFGSSAVAEAFQIAFTLPNLFRQIFAEGAFSSAFIPMFAKKKGQKAETFVSEIWAVLGAALIVLCLLAMVVMPWLILGMAGGFGGDGRLALATDFGRITFAYIIFISLATLLGGILQSSARFGVVAAAPICLNVILCAAMVFAPRFGVAAERALVWGVPLAGIAQLMLVWVFVRRLGFRVRWQWPRITEDVKRLFWIALPTAMAASVLQNKPYYWAVLLPVMNQGRFNGWRCQIGCINSRLGWLGFPSAWLYCPACPSLCRIMTRGGCGIILTAPWNCHCFLFCRLWWHWF